MARILLTGSSDGMGSLTAQVLVQRGHKVVLHARNEQRAKDALAACPGAESVVVGDLSSMAATKELAATINGMGDFDAIVHNAGLYLGPIRTTVDGFPAVFAVNTIAPYILTCLVKPPKRLVYVSSGLHASGNATLRDLTWAERGERGWQGMSAYSDTKLHDVMLAFAFGRRWKSKGITSNVVNPGWVPTKMGGVNATDDLDAAVQTFAMLAEGSGPSKGCTGKYFYHMEEYRHKPAADSISTQEKLLEILEDITGVKAPPLNNG